MLNLLRSFQLWPWPPLLTARRSAILEVTIRVVGRSGYRQASVDMIAAEVASHSRPSTATSTTSTTASSPPTTC
jgi:hypothetical protein